MLVNQLQVQIRGRNIKYLFPKVLLVAEIHKFLVMGTKAIKVAVRLQNSCGQGFLGHTGFQNPNLVVPGFQNLLNQKPGISVLLCLGMGLFKKAMDMDTSRVEMAAWVTAKGIVTKEIL